MIGYIVATISVLVGCGIAVIIINGAGKLSMLLAFPFIFVGLVHAFFNPKKDKPK